MNKYFIAAHRYPIRILEEEISRKVRKVKGNACTFVMRNMIIEKIAMDIIKE
jgi:hypothetical protein